LMSHRVVRRRVAFIWKKSGCRKILCMILYTVCTIGGVRESFAGG
jgi:hypothetical protein